MHQGFTRAALAALALAAAGPATAGAAPKNTSVDNLTNAVTVAGIYDHLNAFQAHADANGGNRYAGYPGHDASAQYVYDRAVAAGYDVHFQEFEYSTGQDLSVLTKVAPSPERAFILNDEFFGDPEAPEGDITAPLTAVDLVLPPVGGSTSGCEAADFDGFPAGSIALIQRGSCDFIVKVNNAADADAAGVIIFNEGNDPSRTNLDFDPIIEGATIPTVVASFAAGSELSNSVTDGPTGTTVRLKNDFFFETLTTRNVVADKPGGNVDNTIVVGGHLDSVQEGPGINDNGSGSATILEIAEQMANVNTANHVRFIWFSAEESGLIGSQYYVDQLSDAELGQIGSMLNFDMVASPNFARFVYNGSSKTAPKGAGAIEDVFNDWFKSRGLAYEPTPFDGRSDYGPFIAEGIPAGGLFTGAEGIKSAAQVTLYGGIAGAAFDPCYHAACDTIANINDTALDQMSDAAAAATLRLAQSTTSINGAHGNGSFMATTARAMQTGPPDAR